MGTPLGPKYIEYIYMDPMGQSEGTTVYYSPREQCREFHGCRIKIEALQSTCGCAIGRSRS